MFTSKDGGMILVTAIRLLVSSHRSGLEAPEAGKLLPGVNYAHSVIDEVEEVLNDYEASRPQVVPRLESQA